jgi:hypothetical protein
MSVAVVWGAGGLPTHAQGTSPWVDTSSRDAVRSFYNVDYQASEGVPMGSTADPANCVPGTNSPQFIESVRNRVNWFRSMAGIPGVAFDPALNGNAQQGALMEARNAPNGGLSHFPPSSWACYTDAGAHAAGTSNLGADYEQSVKNIDAYMDDTRGGTDSQGHPLVGHRRWVLYPNQQKMGTGDVMSGGFYFNVLDWDGLASQGPRPTTRQSFVSWPPQGFVPWQVVYPIWSFAYAGADFSQASVTMTGDSGPVAVSNVAPAAPGYGENTLTWQPAASALIQYADARYTVSVQHVLINGQPTDFTYTVTVFDPSTPPSAGTQAPFTMISSSQSLPQLCCGAVAWADYDNDGRMDFIITGYNGPVASKLYRNTGNGFIEVPVPGLPQLEDSSVSWGDYDNDGRPDLLICGWSPVNNSAVSQLWHNTANGFILVNIPGPPQVSSGAVAWGDYDKDGRLDFLITGTDGTSQYAQLWHNTVGGFTQVSIPGLLGFVSSSVAWADYDNDGRLDFLINGSTNAYPSGAVAQIWRNTGNGFSDVTSQLANGILSTVSGGVAWGDYDNDGHVDFFITASTRRPWLLRHCGAIPEADLPICPLVICPNWVTALSPGRITTEMAGWICC